MDVINVNKRIITNTQEIEISEDVIVPDSKEDLVKVLDLTGNSYLYRIDIQEGKIKLDGNLDCYISYLASSQDTRVLNTTFNFSRILEDSQIGENMNFKYRLDIVKSETKVLNERKVNVSCNLRITYEIFEVQKVEIYNEFENIEGLQMQSSNITVNSVIGMNSSKAQIKEDIKINDIDNIKDILKFDIKIENKETKVSYNKILAKAEARVNVMYITDDNRIEMITDNFPIMSFIDLENVKEDSYCQLDYQIRNIFLKINRQEDHSISCQIDFEIFCEAYENKQISVVSDLYSLKNNIEFDSKEIEVDGINAENDTKSIEIEEKIEIAEIKKVLDVQMQSKILKNTILNENSNIEGEVELKIYYEISSQMGLNVKTVVVPFITKLLASNSVYTEVTNNEFDLEGENVIIKATISVLNTNSKKQVIQIVENVDTSETVSNDNYSMVVYFVKQNDTIWKIAKKFRVTQDSIIRANSLESPNKIYAGDKLYIIK